MTMTTKPIARTALLAGALMMTALPAAAQVAAKVEISAKSNGERITVAVPTSLMTSDDGMEKLYTALQRKAEKSCKVTIPMRIGSSVTVGRCTRKLMNGFVADLDHSGMAALHAQRS